MSQFFTSGGQSIGVSASASVLQVIKIRGGIGLENIDWDNIISGKVPLFYSNSNEKPLEDFDQEADII